MQASPSQAISLVHQPFLDKVSLPGVRYTLPTPARPFANPEHTEVLVTGGTMDSVWYAPGDSVTPGTSSIIASHLRAIQVQAHSSEIVCLLDSRQITDSSRDRIYRSIVDSPRRFHVVTHGTYTIPETAAYLEQRLNSETAPSAKDKVVVITGSFFPADNEVPEATFNMGFSFGVLGFLPPGVYVAAHGTIFAAKHVDKFPELACFRPKGSEFVGAHLNNLFTLHTGGTIGAAHDPAADQLRFDRPYFNAEFFSSRAKLPYLAYDRIVRALDSRRVAEPDREALLERVLYPDSYGPTAQPNAADQYKRILIPHGAFALIETARYLKERLPRCPGAEDKSIVLTASFFPPGYRESDAPFNIGYALGALTGLPPGVFIAINGRIFTPETIELDMDREFPCFRYKRF